MNNVVIPDVLEGQFPCLVFNYLHLNATFFSVLPLNMNAGLLAF